MKDIEKSIGFNLLGASHRDEAIRVVEERNIIVHNRGKANRIFKGKVPNHPAKLGEQITVTLESVKRDAFFLVDCVRDTDARAIVKYNLTTTKSADMAMLVTMRKQNASQSQTE